MAKIVGQRARGLLLASLACPLAPCATAIAAAADDARLIDMQAQLAPVQAQLQQLTEENRSLRERLARLERALAQLTGPLAAPSVTPSTPAAPPTPSAAPPAAANSSALPTPAPPSTPGAAALAAGVRLWGYGEMYYIDPTRYGNQARADLARAVFGLGYSFDERTEFNSEYEVEHAVASGSDPGEFEVEQFYVDRAFSEALSARGGLFLMPFGFLNEHHEPTRFYGVQRNFVETLIIPSTWREGGFNLHGDSRVGFGWNVGLTTGFDLSKWDFAPAFPPYTSALALANSGTAPLQATHQELALANARHLSQYAALSYYGVPALLLGGALSSGESSAPGDPRVTLWEAHARWMPGKLDLSALYARGSISNTGPANAAHPGSPNPLPSSFYGYFLQGAYRLWEQGDYQAAPFVRWERYNLGASYAGTRGPVVPPGLVPLSGGDFGYWPRSEDRVFTAGANFYVGTHLVLKGDYQWFQLNQGFRRFDLGLGVSF
ncbi:MAG TPA: bZIP transcription factor [Steroidobacteraceae bacterium]|nr:bZIP transcription factor [Steroidobacteraceae bacterium]